MSCRASYQPQLSPPIYNEQSMEIKSSRDHIIQSFPISCTALRADRRSSNRSIRFIFPFTDSASPVRFPPKASEIPNSFSPIKLLISESINKVHQIILFTRESLHKVYQPRDRLSKPPNQVNPLYPFTRK